LEKDEIPTPPSAVPLINDLRFILIL